MSNLNPLRMLYVNLNSQLSKLEVKQLKALLADQLKKNELEQLDDATDIFIKLEERGFISQGNLDLLKNLLSAIQRDPLVRDVDTVLKDNDAGSPDFQRADTKPIVQSEDTQHSGHGDVTASSERSSAAVQREMTRAMQDPDGETTSVQHHIDNHSLRRAQYEHIVQQEQRLQEQGVKEQVIDSIGSPTSKRHKCSADTHYYTEIQEQYPDIVYECEKRLKSYYSKLSHILPFPWWDGANRLKLENVYTELELQMKDGNKRDFARQEIFSTKDDGDSHANPKRVLIEGDPGYGKSTFCKKLAYDWAKGTVEYLNGFQLLFYFELKDLLECDGENIQDAIFDQLSWDVREAEKQELWNYIKDNQIKVYFVFDGLDEVASNDLPSYFKRMVQLKKCLLSDSPVIVTSRKVRDINSKQMYDTQLLIKGFDLNTAKAFVEKHINAMNSTGELQTEAKASEFLKELEISSHKKVLFDFMQSPLNTLMLCDIWIYAKRLPHTITELYEEIVDYVVKRYRVNSEFDSNFDREIKQALFLIGEMSYRGLTTREHKVYFSEEDISKNRYIRKLGLLTKISGIPCRYGFYHLTFQEYFASVYVAALLTIDRSKFVDAVHLLTKNSYFKYKDNVFAFIGGKLRSNVGEIFKVWEEKCLCLDLFIDPRPILYESYCESTDVFKHCAKFLPGYLDVDFNTIVRESDSNQLRVNATVLQCADIRSKSISFILPILNADAVAMYQKCYEALLKNGKTCKNICVEISTELNESTDGGKDYSEDFTSISKTQCGSRPDLKPVTVHNFILQIPNIMKSSLVCTDRCITGIAKGFTWVSADNLCIQEIRLGNWKFMEEVLQCLNANKQLKTINVTFYEDSLDNLELMRDVLSCLSINRQLKAVDVTFCENCLDRWQRREMQIKAKIGKFTICWQINNINFDLVDLYNLLSTFACFETDRLSVSLDVSIESDFNKNIECDKLDMLHRLESVDIGQLSLNVTNYITGDHGETDDIYLRASTIVQGLSRVSANQLKIEGLPLGNLDLVRDVLGYLSINELLKAVYVTFCKDGLDHWQTGEINITAKVGKFTTCYKMNNMDFKLVALHDLLSTFVSVDIESVSLDVQIRCGMKEKLTPYIAETLESFESVDISQLSLDITDACGANTADNCLRALTIVKAFSRMSVNELKILGLPLENIESIRDVLSCLSVNRLKAVDVTFCKDGLDHWQTGEINITAKVGKFKTCYKMNNMDFKLVDLHDLLSTLVSFDSERVSLDVRIGSDFKDNIKSNTSDILHRLGSVDIGHLSLNITGADTISTDSICLCTSALIKALSRVSANTIEVTGLPFRNVEFMPDVLSCLNVNRLLEAVDVTFCKGCLEQWQKSDINITTKIGKFTTHYKMSNLDFKLADLNELPSTFVSADDDRMSLDVAIECNMMENQKPNIKDAICRLESVHIGQLSLNITCAHSVNTEDVYLRTSTIVKSLSRVSANELKIEELPFGNIEFIGDVFSCLSTNKQLKAVDVTFCEDCSDQWQTGGINITARVGKFTTRYKINAMELMDFGLLDLHSLLLTFAVDNEQVSLDFQVNCNVKEKREPNITDALHRLASVDIELLELKITGSNSLNREDISLYISTIINALSRVSANKLEFVTERMPILNLEVVRQVVGSLISYKLFKSVRFTFCEDCLDPSEVHKVQIAANIGKFKTSYNMNNMPFHFVELHSFVSSLGSVNDERVSLDVWINCDVKEKVKPNITDILHRLESVDIGLLMLKITGSGCFSQEDISFHIPIIIKALSLVSADKLEFVIERLPFLNLELLREIVADLNSYKLLKSVDLTFCEKHFDSSQVYKMCFEVKAGKFQTNYQMDTINTMDVDLVDLHSLLSSFGSVDDERESLHVWINCDAKEKVKPNITDMLHILESVDIELLMLKITGSGCFNKEDISFHISTIRKALSRVSASKLEFVTERLPFLNLELLREIVGDLNSCKLLKSVYLISCDGCIDHSEEHKMCFILKGGKFQINYHMDTINAMVFDLADLHSLLSLFASVDNERVSLHVLINCRLQKKTKPHISDMFHRLKSVHIEELIFKITSSDCFCKENISLLGSTIIKALSQVSADNLTFVAEGLPLLNLELLRKLVIGLNSYTLLKSICFTFCEDCLDMWKANKVLIAADIGKFKTYYLMNNMAFDLVDLHSLLSTFASVDNERVSLDVAIKCDEKEKLTSNITDTLHKLKSVDLGLLSLNITRSIYSKKEEITLYISTIMEALTEVSADKLEFVTEKIPLLNLELVKEVIGGLNSYKLLKSVHMTFCGESVDSSEALKVKLFADFGKFETCYLMNTIDFIDFEFVDLHSLLTTFVSVDDERVSLYVEIKCDVKEKIDCLITNLLLGLKHADIKYVLLTLTGVSGLQNEGICLKAYANMQALSQLSAKKIYIKRLPLGNLVSMGNVLVCLNNNSLLKSVDIEFCESCIKPEETDKLEILVKFGKFQVTYRMNKMNFSLLGLKESLSQFVSMDSCGIKIVIKEKYDLKQSKVTDLRNVFEQCVSVCIEKMTLQMWNGTDMNTDAIYSHTSDVMQSFSMVDAKEFVISGLPARNYEFIKAVHTDLLNSLPNKSTHISFEPLCFQTCEIDPLEHSKLIAKSSKHTLEFGICKSKFDIPSLYQELHKTLSMDKKRFTLHAIINCNSNIKFDSQYVLSSSKSITFNKVQYVEQSHALFPTIEVLEFLTSVDTDQFSYKSKESLGYNLSKSLVDVLLQYKSAKTVVLSSARQCSEVEIAKNIHKYVNDGMIIHGVKFEGENMTIQGMCANEANTLSKLIEVEFALHHKSNIDLGYDDVEMSHVILDDSNALTEIYRKNCNALKTISVLKSLSINLSDIVFTEFHTCHPRMFLIETVCRCVLALPFLTKVIVVGGKISSTDDSSETWMQLFTKESLEILEFKDCDLNDSCQSVIIDSVNKADECRCSQLRITFYDTLSSQNVDLTKEKLLAHGFVLSDTAGSASQGDIVFSLNGKSVSIVACSCKEHDQVK